MATASSSRPDRGWVQRLIAEEKPAAALLLVAGLLGLALASLLGAPATYDLLHPTIFGTVIDLPWIAADGLLVIFFMVAGLELRHELTGGALSNVRSAAVPVFAAAFGMALPAAIFIALAPADARDAWGVPMATDLPLALALLAVLGRGLPVEFRAFLLTLAIVDDALSILVIAIVSGHALSWQWCAATVLLVVAYAKSTGKWLPTALALAAWLAMLQTGIHPTVLGVALGLVTSSRTDAVRDRLQPIAGLVAVPLFVFTALAVPLTSDALQGPLISALVAARVLGKTFGVALGALLAIVVFRPPRSLPRAAYFTAGAIASLGFSVSLLFAELTLPAETLAPMKAAVVSSLLAGGVVGAAALRWLRHTLSTR